MEVALLGLVCLSPWAYGAVHPGFTFLLYAGVALLLVLWATRLLLEGQLTWQKCPVALCLAGLFLATGLQVTPLPPGLLARISPGTADLYRQLLPTRPEVLPGGETRDAVTPPPGTTLSLDPGATRQVLLQILAAFLVFAVVRNNLTSPAALRRLCAVALINGALLALFALVQFFTSPHNMLYWTYPSLGQVFGPFVNRNHFAFYLNLCIGLGLGLLLAHSGGPAAGVPGRRDEARWSAPGLLQDPLTLWLSAALALMLGAVLFSLSRGGLLALVAAGLVAVLARPARSPGSSWLRAVGLAVALGLGLVVWFGVERVEARVSTLWHGDALYEARLPLWARTLPLAERFPVWGTGQGTFGEVELLTRTAVEEVSYVHADNEYVEGLVEGGAVRLLLGVAAVGLVFALARRALLRSRDSWERGLVVGLLFAFTTLAVHSLGDFGLHIPAIALLAAVLCAHLCALGCGNPAPEPGATPAGDGASGQYTLRLGGLAPVLGAATAVALGLLLTLGGWRAHGVHQLRAAAVRALQGGAPDARQQQIACLETAARLAPGLADLQADLGQARLDAFEDEAGRLNLEGRTFDLARVAGDLAPAGTPAGPAPVALAAARAGLPLADLRPPVAAEQDRLTQRSLVPALKNILRARDLSPLLPQAHVRLAANVRVLNRADPRLAYLERARLLAPADPWLWYLCGTQELAESHQERAWADWRHSLELSDSYLTLIVEQSARVLGPDEAARQVLPDRPAVLLATAYVLYPEADDADRRRPLFERALALLDGPVPAVTGEDFRVRALAHAGLGQRPEAGAAYEAALAREPGQAAWRLEYAKLLYDDGRLPEARHQVLVVLAQEPGNAQGRALLDQVTRAMARSM
jgi:tetratricopeptide (TPR) repeat protein